MTQEKGPLQLGNLSASEEGSEESLEKYYLFVCIIIYIFTI